MYSQMVTYIKGNFLITKNMEMENINFKMEIIMMEVGFKIKKKVKEFITIKVKMIIILENGKIIISMVKVNIYFQMEMFTMVNL